MSDHQVHPLVASGAIRLTVGVHDALSAKLAERGGFRGVVVPGYPVAASLLRAGCRPADED